MGEWLECLMSFSKTTWDKLNVGDVIYYTLNRSENIHGPFKITNIETRSIVNSSGFELSMLTWPITLWTLDKNQLTKEQEAF